MMTTAICATADLFDRYHQVAAPLPLPWINYGRRASFFGQTSTAATSGDPACVRRAVEQPGLGRILVITGQQSVALVGDRLGRLAADNGWSGIIVAGFVRDVAELTSIDIGIKALGSTPARSFDHDGNAAHEVAVYVGDVIVHPGDWLYADLDGVLLSRQRLALD